MPLEEFLQLSGFEEIDGFDKGKVKESSLRFLGRYEKELRNIEFLKIHLKECCKQGSRTKYFIHSMLAFSGTQIVSKADEWNISKAVDESLNRMEREIEKWMKRNEIK
ncbi:MAG: hypothetical protein ABIE23_03520 [archaeon]|nr:hypothetical protein [Candidatus Micrarchaeota archaeon]